MSTSEVETAAITSTDLVEVSVPFSVVRLEGAPLSTVEELWKIFTYYTMHTNTAMPEILKV